MPTIHQTLLFSTSALDLYNCLLDERIHSSFTGAEAKITDKENDTFTAWDGYIEGKNIVLERGKKIVWKWKANEEAWPEGHWSEVVFILSDNAEGAQLEMIHSFVPDALTESLSKGWHEYYWEPLRFYLER